MTKLEELKAAYYADGAAYYADGAAYEEELAKQHNSD